MNESTKLFRLVLVPSPIRDDLISGGLQLPDLLNYDEARRVLSKNSLSIISSLNSKFSPEISKLVHGSEKFIPILDEVLDMNEQWLSINPDYVTEDEIDNNDTKDYEKTRNLGYVINGIGQTPPTAEGIYENITTANNGKVFFVVIPYINNDNTDDNTRVVTEYSKLLTSGILRKASVYHSEKDITQTSLFTSYLINL